MRVCDYIAQRLAEEGITDAFVVQGAANNDLIYAIADTPGIHYRCLVHEQAAGFAAEGWAKVRGNVPGLAIATSGPGGQNLVTCIANCFYDSVPVLFITGQVSSKFMRPSDDSPLRQVGFQETPMHLIAAPITKHSACVKDPRDIRYELEHALWLCREGRPGPVLLDIPVDVQRTEIGDPFELAAFGPPRVIDVQGGCGEAAEAFFRDFVKARRPVLLIGGGVRGPRAIEAFHMLAEALQAPCFPTWNALDVVTSDSPFYCGRVGTYGGAGRNFAIQNCDLLLAVGCRLSGRITGGNVGTFAREATRWVVDVDDALLDTRNQQLPFHHSVKADAAAFMQAVERCVRNYRSGSDMGGPFERPMPDHSAWLAQAQMWRRLYDPVRPDMTVHSDAPPDQELHPYIFIRELSRRLPDNAVVINDCGGNAVICNHAFETKAGQRYFSNNGNSPMGFAFAAAIGAWFADPTRPVICIIGDGGFCMNVQELQTLVNYGVPVKTFILNNSCYGITRAFQETHYNGRLEASVPGKGYAPPDFMRVADAFGVNATRIRYAGTAAKTLRQILEGSGEAFVCDLDIGDFHDYSPRIFGWETPIEDMFPYLPRDEFSRNMIVEPVAGWETPAMPGQTK